MKTEDDIRNEYIKKLEEYSTKREIAANTNPDGSIRDRSKDIYVTDICVWDTYCPKQVFYSKTNKRHPTPEGQMRFTIGEVVHEIPLWYDEDPLKNGHEVRFQWNGLSSRFDEINFEDGIIIDKKTVASLPRKPKEYVTKQLNIYRVMAEDNDERPTKIKQLFALNISVTNGAIQAMEIPMWSKQETYEFIERVRGEMLYHLDNKLIPNVACFSKGWICDNCQYTDLCMRDVPGGVSAVKEAETADENKNEKKLKAVTGRVKKKAESIDDI